MGNLTAGIDHARASSRSIDCLPFVNGRFRRRAATVMRERICAPAEAQPSPKGVVVRATTEQTVECGRQPCLLVLADVGSARRMD
jgi:hypothetical protein